MPSDGPRWIPQLSGLNFVERTLAGLVLQLPITRIKLTIGSC